VQVIYWRRVSTTDVQDRSWFRFRYRDWNQKIENCRDREQTKYIEICITYHILLLSFSTNLCVMCCLFFFPFCYMCLFILICIISFFNDWKLFALSFFHLTTLYVCILKQCDDINLVFLFLLRNNICIEYFVMCIIVIDMYLHMRSNSMFAIVLDCPTSFSFLVSPWFFRYWNKHRTHVHQNYKFHNFHKFDETYVMDFNPSLFSFLSLFSCSRIIVCALFVSQSCLARFPLLFSSFNHPFWKHERIND
jgi:hypothetical protein